MISSALSFLGTAAILFDRNSAAAASVMYVASSSTSLITLSPPPATSNTTMGLGTTSTKNIFINDNVCRTTGGTVFWFRDPPQAFAVKSAAFFQVSSFYFFILLPYPIYCLLHDTVTCPLLLMTPGSAKLLTHALTHSQNSYLLLLLIILLLLK